MKKISFQNSYWVTELRTRDLWGSSGSSFEMNPKRPIKREKGMKGEAVHAGVLTPKFRNAPPSLSLDPNSYILLIKKTVFHLSSPLFFSIAPYIRLSSLNTQNVTRAIL